MGDSGKGALNLDASGGLATFGGGNVVVSVRDRMRDGVKLWIEPIATAVVRRTRTRARGTGCRPKAQATASSRGGDSGDDDLGEPGEPPPPSGRLCEFCGGDIPADRSPLAEYCSDRHADRDRQRRKRDRDRPGEDVAPRVAVCRCNGRHLELEPGHCTRCGHWLPDEVDHSLEHCLLDAHYGAIWRSIAREAAERNEALR
jgi:hypothetical protein